MALHIARGTWVEPPHHYGILFGGTNARPLIFVCLYPLFKLGHAVMHTRHSHSHFISECQLAFDSYIKFENGTTHVQCSR